MERHITMDKLLSGYDEMKAIGEIACVILEIHMPTGEVESIVNPNVASKIEYVKKAYDSNLVHKSNNAIWIEDVIFSLASDTMTFGDAIESMKSGYRVARKGWNGKGQYIELARNISFANANGELINAEHESIGNAAIAFYGTSGIQMGWLASQADMLAEDWYELDDAE